jgi:4-aminobutyrate aminotransferase
MGDYFMAKLNEYKSKYSFIKEVRGLGLMIGMEVADESGAPDGVLIEKLVEECFKRKLLLLDCGIKNHIIRFIPPLNVSKAEIDKALSIIDEALPVAAARRQSDEAKKPAESNKPAEAKKSAETKKSGKDASVVQPIA